MYRFLLRACFWGAVLFMSFADVKGQEFTTITEKVRLEKDTVWLVNPKYNTYKPTLKLTLDFSEPGLKPTAYCKDAKVASSFVSIGTQNSITLDYAAGLHELQLKDETGKIYYYMVFNKILWADFEVKPYDPFRRCIEAGGDSLLIVKKNFEDNPPTTVYEIYVEGAEPIYDTIPQVCSTTEWFGPKLDSAWVVFYQPTGVKPCDVSLRLSYVDAEKNITLEEETNVQRVNVFGAPDVKKIFGWAPEDSFNDKGQSFLKVCSTESQKYLNLDESILNYFQVKLRTPQATPYYSSYEQKAGMDIKYYYSDTIYDNMPKEKWKDVTGLGHMVSVEQTIAFLEAGYYKMMITAENLCNEVGGVKKDTLWTDLVEGSPDKHRYFQVFSSNPGEIVCETKRLCMTGDPDSRTIKIVDNNSRRGYEPPPTYDFRLQFLDPSPYVNSNIGMDAVGKKIEIWRGRRILSDSEAENGGCDSTIIYLTFNSQAYYGTLEIDVDRQGQEKCGSSQNTFMVEVGRSPKITRMEIFKELSQKYGFDAMNDQLGPKGAYPHCDTVRYALPIDSLSKEDNTRGFALDSVCWYIRKGSAPEKTLVYRFGDQAVPTELLDSLDVITTSRLVSYNVCGASEPQDFNLFIATRPRVELLRDAVSSNDSLCIGLEYSYAWKGTLPKDYTIQMTPTAEVYVNGMKNAARTEIELKNGDKIRYEVAGPVDETFVIRNTKMPACAWDSIGKLEMLALPDTLLHRDSVGYCMGSPEFNAVKLFKPGKSDFKWGEWKLNAGAVQKVRLPDLKLTGGVDTLRYKLSRSKGCYVEGKLLLRPRTVPELKLKDEAQFCLPDTIFDFRKESFVEKITLHHLIVYKDKLSLSMLRYEDYSTGPAPVKFPLDDMNGKMFIYEIKNTLVDSALMGKCRIVDTVLLKVSAPKLKVKGNDELRFPWEKYEFASVQTKDLVDTAQLDPSSLQWRLVPDNKICGTGLYGGAYTLTDADKTKDTLKFEVSARSLCGDELKDTLYVELIHLKIQGYKDTICSNEEGYPLWKKVQSSHVDPASVRWKIVYPPAYFGKLTGEMGTDVKYKPEDGTDSVRIWFEAALEGAPEVNTFDTVVLKINPAPRLRFARDTLWACNNMIDVTRIASDYLAADNTTAIGRGDYVLAPGQTKVGGWHGNNYEFPKSLAVYDSDLFQRVTYQAVGLPGCQKKNAVDTVVLAQPVPARVIFKRKHEEMCAGDRLQLDTLYTVKGEDPFVRYEWTLAGDSEGRYEENYKYYLASSPEDRRQELIVATYKEYTCYDGKSSGQVLKHGPTSLSLTVHRPPEFEVVDTVVILCKEMDEVSIKRDWVMVKEGLYPDYRDSVLVDELPLRNDGLLFQHTQPGDTMRYKVSIAQGRCTNWKESSKLIQVYRLPAMITGTIPDMTVCEGTSIVVNKSQLEYDRLAPKPIWEASGGKLVHEADGTIKFEPTTGSHLEGEVMVTVNPPYGCPKESVKGVVKVGREPHLKKRSDVFCQVAGHTAIVSGELESNTGVVLNSIKWYRIADVDKEITTGIMENGDLELEVTEADLAKSPLLLRAAMSCSGACSGLFNDTVSITWQAAPVITVASGLQVCQAKSEGIALGQKVSVANGNGNTWKLETIDKGTWNNETLTFVPGDESGTARITVTASGLANCPEESATVEVEILAAPASGIRIDGARCSTRELTLQPENGRADNGYAWEFGDGNKDAGASVKHSYAQTGVYTVTMTGEFQNGCVRAETEEVTINLRPTANFDILDPAPINTPVEMVSMSTPEDVTCNWLVEGTTYSGTPAYHIFNSEGTYAVRLEVETPQGCKDTYERRTKVLSKPKANFDVEVDSCVGKVTITNRSELHDATIAWDFGNGQSVSTAENPGTVSYPQPWRDTTYTITLTLENVSGSSTVSRSFVMKSKLEPKFDFLTTEPCSKIAKKLEVLARGEADTIYLDWGDGTKEYWTKGNAKRLWEHSYAPNDTWEDKKYTVTMQSVNACHREVYSKELTVVPGKREVALWDSCHNKIGCYKSDWDFRKRSYGFLEDGYMCTWDFGDGARESNPADKVTHVYDHPGTYVVVATVEDRCESRVVKDTVKVVGNDSLDFELAKTVACVGDTVEVRFVQRGEEVFTGLTWTLPGNLFETIRNEDVVKYVCRKAGSKQIKLSAWAASGCPEETISKSLRIAETPDVRILGMNAARPDSAECVPFDLQPRAMDWNDCQATVRWDFGNGDLSGERYPKTTYREPGKYTVRLTMTTPEGCTDTDTLPVVAKKTPVPMMALKDSLVCSTSGDFELTAYNRTEDIEENSYRWKSQSEERYERDSVTFSFKGFWGSEEILLRAQNRETMCTSTAQVTFVMSKALKASLAVSPDTVCAGMEVVFRDTLSLAGATCEFYFDDGTLDDSREVRKTYWERGKYAYRFVQRNADGCTDTLRDEIFVHTLPVAEFEWRETVLQPNIENLRPGIELPEKGNGGVRFTNHSTLDPMEGEGSGLYYYWDFGDGQSAREKEPAHRFGNNGVYDVVLYAVTELGCRDSVSHLVDDITAIKGLFFPNAVVPASSDPGVNRFQPKGIGLHTFTLKLYAQDGTCVWQTNKLDDGRPAEYWDGTYNGQPVPAGVYNWEASALFIDGTVQNHINGALIVIR